MKASRVTTAARTLKGLPALGSLGGRGALGALAVVGGVGMGGLLRNAFQHRRVFRPERFPDGDWDARALGLPVEDVWLETSDRVALHGWWLPHARPRGTLLFFHGNSGSLGHLGEVLRHLHLLELDLFAFDYRGYGRSAGSPRERGLYLDAEAAHAWVTGRRGRSPDRLLLFGHSLGGAVAIECARRLPAAGLIVQASFTDTRAAAAAIFPRTPLPYVARRQFRSIDKVDTLTLPKLFVHGVEDATIPPEHSRRLHRRAAGPKSLLLVPRVGHNDFCQLGGDAYLTALRRFRDACLDQ